VCDDVEGIEQNGSDEGCLEVRQANCFRQRWRDLNNP
jgi:hypothetical protein